MPELIVLARVLSGPPSQVAHVLAGRRVTSGVLALPSDLVAAVLLYLSWTCVFGGWARVGRWAHWHAGRLFALRVVAHSRWGETRAWRRYVRSREQNRLLGFQLLRCTRVLELETQEGFWKGATVGKLVAVSCPNLRTMVWRWRTQLPFPCAHFHDVLVESRHEPAQLDNPPLGRWRLTFEEACDALEQGSLGAAVLVHAPALERVQLLVNVQQDSFSLNDAEHPEYLRQWRYRGGAGVLGDVLPRLVARRVSPLHNLDVTVWLPHNPEEWRSEVQSVMHALARIAQQVVPRGTQTWARLAAVRESKRLEEACVSVPDTTIVLDVLSAHERRDLRGAMS